MSNQNDSRFNNKNTGVQNILYTKARDIFTILRKEIDPDSAEIDLDKLRAFINLHQRQTSMKDQIIKMICSYHLPEKILNNQLNTDKTFNIKLSEEEFCNFISGKELKSIIFNDNIDKKRNKIEELTNLYYLMGGTSNGITKESLSTSISKVFKLYASPEEYFSNNFDSDKGLQNYNKEAGEIISLLSTNNNDRLSLEDFVNVMSLEFNGDFDLLNPEMN